MTINQAQDEIIEEFSMFEDWMQKYEYLIEFGRELPPLAESEKVDTNRVKGCQSKVWLSAREDAGKLYFDADSDAMITKGIVGLLLRILSGQEPADIAQAELYAIQRIGLDEHLSPNRANGLAQMIKKIKMYALAHTPGTA